MTLAYSVIQDSIRDFILAAGNNERVIFYYPNAPIPEKPYTSIQLLSNSGVINDWQELNTDTEELEVFGVREMAFSINCYGDNAADEVNVIQGRSRLDAVNRTLKKYASISVWNMSNTRDLSGLLDDQYEFRYQFDVLFNVPLEDGSTTDNGSTGVFDQVGSINGTIIE